VAAASAPAGTDELNSASISVNASVPPTQTTMAVVIR